VWSLISGVERYRSWWPWLLGPGNTALAVVSRVAAPRVLDSAARQFIARALEPALGDAAS
jgi:hypothetical protein